MFRRTSLWVFAVTVIAILTVTSGYLAYYYGYQLPARERAAKAERERLLQEKAQKQIAVAKSKQPLDMRVRRGLAHADAVMLGFFNNKYARDTSANISLADIETLRVNGLSKFVDVLDVISISRGSIQETYFGFYPQAGGSALTPVITLLGSFNSREIQQRLLSNQQAETLDDNGISLTVLPVFDEVTCEKTESMALFVTNEYMVIGNPKLVSRIVKRTGKGSLHTSDYVSPDKWHNFNTGKTLSVWLRHPATNIRRFFPSPYNSFVKESNLRFRTFVDAFAAYKLSDMAKGHLSLELHGRNINDVLQVYKTWNKVLHEQREPLSLQVRLLDKAMNLLHLETDARMLKMSLSMERAWYQKWPEVMRRVTRYVTDKLNRLNPESTKQQSPMMVVDRLASNPPVFKRSVQLIDLRPYEARFLPNRSIDFTTGPFGIALDNVEDNGEGGSFTLSVVGTHIPNLGDGIGKAMLTLSRVAGKNGRPLQNQSVCGPKRFISNIVLKRHEEIDLYEAALTVHLEPGINISEVATVEGNIGVALPVKTSTHPLFLPSKLPYTERVRDLKITFFALNSGVIQTG